MINPFFTNTIASVHWVLKETLQEENLEFETPTVLKVNVSRYQRTQTGWPFLNINQNFTVYDDTFGGHWRKYNEYNVKGDSANI